MSSSSTISSSSTEYLGRDSSDERELARKKREETKRRLQSIAAAGMVEGASTEGEARSGDRSKVGGEASSGDTGRTPPPEQDDETWRAGRQPSQKNIRSRTKQEPASTQHPNAPVYPVGLAYFGDIFGKFHIVWIFLYPFRCTLNLIGWALGLIQGIFCTIPYSIRVLGGTVVFGFWIMAVACVVIISSGIWFGQAIESSSNPLAAMLTGFVVLLGYGDHSFTRWTHEEVCPMLPFQGRALMLDLRICPSSSTKRSRMTGDNEAFREKLVVDIDELDSMFKKNKQWLLIINKNAEVKRMIATLQNISNRWRRSYRVLYINSGRVLSPPQSSLSSSSDRAEDKNTDEEILFNTILTELETLNNLQESELANFRATPDLIILMLSKTRYSLLVTAQRIDSLSSALDKN
ncbi:hypothetical protein DL95DRAFT_412444 [Leptodontidium sp. 2 PMI_412]|nr:hypothetical protein DL95DRAFT_412444 [Leptodontidium sp. 2 PMI_412]